jgi:hypothetical protein
VFLPLLAGSALAHRPHDTVVGVAVPGAAAPWWAVVTVYDGGSILYRSDDEGATWPAVGGNPVRDRLLGAAGLDDGRAVLLAPTRTWWWDGETWTTRELPGDASMVAGGDAAWLGGEGGLWREDEQVWTAPVRYVGARVAVGEREVWADGDVYAGEMTAAGFAGDTLYAGDTNGTVWRREGEAWVACAALPDLADIREIARFGMDDDGALLVATALRGPYRSADGCASWDDVHAPLDAAYGSPGDAESPADAFTALTGPVAAGWAGLAVRDGDGWTEVPLIPPDLTRGLVFDGPDRVFLGTYAAGVAVTDDGGLTFTVANQGLTESAVGRLVPGRSGLWLVAGHALWRSRDRARSWEEVPTGLRDVTEVWEDDHPGPGRPSVWVFGETFDDGPEVAASDDGGERFGTPDALREALGTSRPHGITRVDAGLCVGAREPAVVVCGEGEAWAVAWAGEGDELVGPLAYAGEPLFAADDAILLGDTPLFELPDDPVRALAVDDDGGILAATASGWLVRDGAHQDIRFPAPAHVLAPRPGHVGQVLVGTHDGAFLVDGGRLDRWAPFQRIDDRSALLACEGCGDARAEAGAAQGSVRPLEGGLARAWLRGHELGADASGCAQVEVDGAPVDLGWDGTVEVGPGWHEVVVRGEGVEVDGLEARAGGVTLAPSGGCRGAGMPGLMLGCGLLRRGARHRRRPRDTGRPPGALTDAQPADPVPPPR